MTFSKSDRNWYKLPLPSLSEMDTVAGLPTDILEVVVDNETVNNSVDSTISSSVVAKLTVLGPVSPAWNVTDRVVLAKSLSAAVTGAEVTLK